MLDANDGSDDEHFDEDANENLVLARQIMEGKRRKCTRVMYKRKIELFTAWIKDVFPNSFDTENEHLILPLDPDIIVEFMAKISIVQDKKTGVKRQASVSVIGSYRSSIAMLYEENNIKFDDATMLALNKFAGGIRGSLQIRS
jgi:hypothetical protein